MNRLIASIRQVGRTVDRLQEFMLCAFLLLMIILGCLQILSRDFFDSGFIWIDPLLRYLVIWSGLFGAIVATRKGKHIVIDLSSHLLPPRAKPWLAVANNLFAAAVCLALTYAAVVFVKNEASLGDERQLLGLSSWILNLVFPVSFSFISWEFLTAAVANFREIIGPPPSPNRLE
jgi:TRAP-type C4-dicarboxylate transport system permease small subunit